MDQDNFFNTFAGNIQPDLEFQKVVYPFFQIDQQRDFHDYMFNQYSQTKSDEFGNFSQYFTFQQPRDQPFELFNLNQKPIEIQTTNKIIQEEEKMQIQISKGQTQKQDENFTRVKKTKKISKDIKTKNKKNKEQQYNKPNKNGKTKNMEKRKTKPRGNNTNNQPKIFGRIVMNVLKKGLNYELSDDYHIQARYYLHSAFSLAQGQGKARQFLELLQIKIQEKISKRSTKDEETGFFNTYIESILLLKEYICTGDINYFRNSFQVIYNQKEPNIDGLESYNSKMKNGYQLVEKIRKLYKLKCFKN